MLIALTLVVGGLLGAYLGGSAVQLCTVGPAGGPVGSCDTDIRLSPIGAVIGALVALAALLTRALRGRTEKRTGGR